MSYAATNWHVHILKSYTQGFPQKETNGNLFSLLMTPQYSSRLALMINPDSRYDRTFGVRVSRDQDIGLEAKALLFALHVDLTSFAGYLLSRMLYSTRITQSSPSILSFKHESTRIL
jgi:hypothetical protein